MTSRKGWLLEISKMQMEYKTFHTNDLGGTIIIKSDAVFHDNEASKTTHCFPYKDIISLEFKQIVIYYNGRNREVTGCVFVTPAGARTMVCNSLVYEQIKEAWMAYYD